ncbi:MAG: RtcB family protein, partial [Sphaerochaeta sp.]|nr:RtcB family protein [Sphaerochaeta sp.]
MIVTGKYGSAKVFAKDLEDGAREQIATLLDQDFLEGSKVRIMPDVHQGMGCVIGFTADMGDKVIPNIVGVDIGCGMLTVELGKTDIDLPKLDRIVTSSIPSGRNTHQSRAIKFDRLQDLHIFRELKDTKRLERSIGTLGGGNHFIEVGVDSGKNSYLVIHSGSRNLGTQVARWYQNLAIDLCSGKEEYFRRRDEIIESYNKEGKGKQLKAALN